MKKGGEGRLSDKKERFIKWFSEINKDSVLSVGGKGANLGEMWNLKIPVPPGFVVTTNGYGHFMEKSGLNEKIKKILSGIDYEDTDELEDRTDKIRKIMIESEMPKEMEDEIIEAYEMLNAEEKEDEKGALKVVNNESIYVAVRSSATAEDTKKASFAGQQDSFVNVRGHQSLIENIKKCFASLYTARATYYRNKEGFGTSPRLAAVIQRMVNSEKSGVMFSENPAFKDNNIVIEAVFGLGEGIVSGEITPDTYTISRKGFKVTKRFISDKKIQLIRGKNREKVTVKLSPKKSKSQVLNNYEIKTLSALAMKLEKHYHLPQDMEFAIEGGEVFLVQTRAITTIGRRADKNSSTISGEVILSGMAASPGVGAGTVKIIHTLRELDKIKKGDILVTTMTNPDMVVAMQRAAGIVTDEGGMTSHAAIVSREMGIPAVVGTEKATKTLKDGDEITVDGGSGKVFKGKVAESRQKEVREVKVKTKIHIKLIVDLPSFAERAALTGLKRVGLTRMEGIIAEGGKHPNYFVQNGRYKEYEDIIYKGVSAIAKYFDELWIRTSDIRSDEFRDLKGAPKQIEVNPMLGMHGIRYSAKHTEILKAELRALKRLADRGKKIGVLSPQIISADDVRVIKKAMKEINFHNCKLGVMVETPAAVQVIDQLCDEGIKFISFGTNDLTQFTLAIDRGNELVQDIYNEMNPAILREIEHVIKVCKERGVETSICGQAGSRKEMAKFLFEKGINSITVNADVAADIAEFIHELESKKR